MNTPASNKKSNLDDTCSAIDGSTYYELICDDCGLVFGGNYRNYECPECKCKSLRPHTYYAQDIRIGCVMKIRIQDISGYEHAMLGLGLSYGITSNYDKWADVSEEIKFKVENRAHKIFDKEGGHNKFLESIYVWLDITATRKWWSQADTYRLSTKQSESSMHTIMKNEITQEMFNRNLPDHYLIFLNEIRKKGDIEELKDYLPEGFLQRRIWVMNYKCLRNICKQREHHKLEEWKYFFEFISDLLPFSHFVTE